MWALDRNKPEGDVAGHANERAKMANQRQMTYRENYQQRTSHHFKQHVQMTNSDELTAKPHPHHANSLPPIYKLKSTWNQLHN